MEDNNTQTINSDDKKFNPIWIIVGLLVLGIGGWMLMNSNKTADNSVVVVENRTTTQPTVMNPNPSGATDESTTLGDQVDADGVITFELEGGSFYFKPDEIRVKKGDKVKVVLNSVDMMHDFVIDELDVKTEIIKSGDTGMVEFTADTPGTYEFYCSVGEHRKQGMVGTLIVE